MKHEQMNFEETGTIKFTLSKRNILLLTTGIILFIVIALGFVYFSSRTSTTGITSNNVAYGANSGSKAPDFQIQLTNGSVVKLSSFRGHPVLLWFVATWCPTCQYGAQLLSQQYYSQLQTKGVNILTVELYNNLGQSGPSITQFANQYGGGTKSGWFYGTSNQDTTYTYDSQAYLDIYYAIDSSGTIVASGIGLPNNLQNLVSTF